MSDELDRFERGAFDPAAFPHREHVRIGHALVSRHCFAEALPRMARGLRTMALLAGRPSAYNETITTAFLSLIAERRMAEPGLCYARFAEKNADLFEKSIIQQHYSADRLQSDGARSTFLLPDQPTMRRS